MNSLPSFTTICPQPAPELSELSRTPPSGPFAQEALDFLHRLSARILQDKTYRVHAGLVALAYWLRPASTAKMAQEINSLGVIKPRGLVFHITPSNVGLIFAYSWFVSLLAGNNNIVRLPSVLDEESDILIKLITEHLGDFPGIRQRSLLVQYGHNDTVTELFSSMCHTRIIWGGDATIAAIRRVPIPPRSTELTFADKFSICVLDAKKFTGLASPAAVVNAFFTDAYLFWQKACSSPRAVVWQGPDDSIAQASKTFWDTLASIVAERQPAVTPAMAMDKRVAADLLAAQGHVRAIDETGGSLCRLRLEISSGFPRNEHCGGGLFYEYWVKDINEITPYITSQEQTLTYWGLEKDELRRFAREAPLAGIDRIVPIGQALRFSHVWDGKNLLIELTRMVSIR